MEKVDANRILEFLQSEKTAMISFLEELVQAESPTGDTHAQQFLLDTLKEKLETLGFSVVKMPGKQTGGYIMARPEKRTRSKPIQLLVGHCDTVWPINTLESMPLTHENGKIKGPGVYDMKAGLTQIIYALKTLREFKLEMPYSAVVLINSDEEKGSRESAQAIRRLARIATRAYILEPPLGLDGKLKTARKGLGRFTLTVKGKSAHAGLEPEKGASAILELSHQVQELFKLNDPKKGTTVNVGMIEGGTNPNMVAPKATAIIDVRVLNVEDGKSITEVIRNLKPSNPQTELKVEGSMGRPPMEKTERNLRLWLAAQKAGARLGLDLEDATAGGGSDGNITSLYAATLDGLGTTGDGAHAKHEFIFLEKLIERTALLTLLLLMD